MKMYTSVMRDRRTCINHFVVYLDTEKTGNKEKDTFCACLPLGKIYNQKWEYASENISELIQELFKRAYEETEPHTHCETCKCEMGIVKSKEPIFNDDLCIKKAHKWYCRLFNKILRGIT
jgi:hypothetical protein